MLDRMATATPDELPGSELVARGLTDLAAGRETRYALLLSRFSSRLQEAGVELPSAPLPDAELRLYELLSGSEGAGAHSAYNALTRRLVSYLRAAERARDR
jgi:hypothetical protein